MKHSLVHSQLIYRVRADLYNLYDSAKVAQQVEYLLKGDRYQCNPKGYKVCFNMSNSGFKRSAGNLTERFTCSTSGFGF